MHELSLAQDMVDQIIAAAQRENALGVERVVVLIGAFSGVEREAFEFAFPFAVEGTIAEHAELVVEEDPAQAVCGRCGAIGPPGTAGLICEACGSDSVTLRGGREFLIRSVDLEIPD